jgi:cytochrome P450
MPLADIRSYMSDRVEFFARRGNGSAGAVVRCRLPGDGYLLREPEDIRHVLVRNSSNYLKSRRIAAARAEYPNQHTLMTSEGEEHRRRRRALQKVFRGPLRARVAARSHANAERLAASWRAGQEVDVARAMTELTQRAVLEALLGSPSESQLVALAAATRARQRAFDRHFVSLFPLLEYVPTGFNWDHLRATRLLRGAFESEVARRRASGERPDDVLSVLMDAEFDDGARAGDREVRDELMTISLTGYDTLSEALVWVMYALGRHPATGERVAAEARAASANGGGGGRPRLTYTTSVVRETLRLYPPTWILVRISRGADRLPSGAAIPPRARVYLCPFVTHRSARHWPEPLRFAPRRFDDGATANRPRYAYFPFGGGEHACVAETIAFDHILTVLAAIAPRHRLALPAEHTLVPEGGLTLRPRGGLTMRVESRNGR